ncbi:LST8 protein, partial [Leiothrix lutea]|nr:LST8 protein [Leiothrix lutea]
MNAAQGTVGSDPVILATAGYDHTVRFWQAHSGICTRTVQHQDSVSFLPRRPGSSGPPPAFGPPGRARLMLRTDLNGARSRLCFSGICTLECFSCSVANLPPNAASQTEAQTQSRAPVLGASSRLLLLQCLESCGRVSLQAELIVGDQSGAIHIWDLKTDHNEQLIPEPEVSVNSVHIDPDASYMAAVNSSGNCYVWNLTGGIGEEVTQLIPKTKIPAHNRYALQCKFSPDSTTSNFSLMTELSIKSNNPGETSRGWMWDCAFSGDSQYIVTASSDNLARLWCVETGEIKREYSGHQKAVVCLAFNDSVLG